MGGGSEVVASSEGGPGEDQEEPGSRGVQGREPEHEAGQEKPSITDYLNKGTLRLLEFLVTEKDDHRYSLSEVAEELGVATSTVSRNCRKLLEVGILLEYEYPRGETGRPIIVIEVDRENEMVDILARWIAAFRDYLFFMQESA